MSEILLCALMLAILGTGAFFAAHYVIELRHSRNVIADELKRAADHINELEDRLMMLEAERDMNTKATAYRTEQPDGWQAVNIRS